MCDRDGAGCFFSKKEGRDGAGDMATSPRRQTPQNQNQATGNQAHAHRQPGPPAMVVQGDFRKVSGISTEIFRQIETVENDHDATTAAALEAVERRGEMLVRVLDPRHVGRAASDAVKRFLALQDGKYGVFLVEIVKRPGQTLGLYIREGNGHDRTDGVFISRIALESAVYNSGCLKVGDEILAVNLVDVTRMSLDDVVIIMSIPRRLVLATRQRKAGQGGVASPLLQTRSEHKAPPVVVMKRDMRDEEDREEDCRRRDRDARDRMDAREQLTTSRSRLGLTGLGSQHHLDSNGHDAMGGNDLYYNSRPEDSRRGERRSHDQWSYQPPPPPVITEQPKTQHYQPYERGYPNTLESLAEKIHAFYGGPMPGPGRRASGGGTRSGLTTPTTPMGGSGGGAYYGATRRAHVMPRSGSDQHLPRTEYTSHTALRSSLKSHGYGGRGDPPSRQQQFTTGTLTRRHRPALDYASDTEATCSASPRTSYYYYRQGLTQASRPPPSTAPLMSSGLRSNSLPRDHRGRPSVPRHHGNVRFDARPGGVGGLVDHDDSDGALSAPELPSTRRDRGRLSSSPSVFTASEYRAWLSRTPSTSAIYERIRQSREMVQRQRAARFSCSAENINLLHRSEDAMAAASASGYVSASGYRGPSAGGHVTSTLDRHQYRHQSTASSAERNASSLRRMRHLLELEARHCMPTQSTPSTPSRHSPALEKQRCLEINPAEFIKYKPDKPLCMMSDSEPGVSGLLWVHLLAGRGLRSTASSSAASTPGTPSGQPPMGVGGSGGLRDLYCVLECDRVHKARTVVRTGDLVFDWDETFELDLVDNRELDLLIYSWDPQYRHKLCYKGSVRLASVLQECPMHQLALKMEPRGTLYVRLRHSDPHQTFRRRGPQTHMSLGRKPTTSLYGSDLEAVVAREGLTGGVPGGVPTSVTLATQGGSAPPLPLIVRRCVEEIERRGLDIIGLYRLCGSASKKRVLREAFERNARTVDLSPDNVPDINVITGVLKDYLRELPEPLFTKCLYQMMVDALSVCLPDDPAGNAKLMFSILDCLPKVNRCTLIYLLDHLALVTSQSDRNKMTAQNLAVCFGPVLMLQSEEHQELQFNQPISVLKYLLEIWPAKSVRELSTLPTPGVAATTGGGAPSCRLSSAVQQPPATQPATQPRPTIIGGPWTLGRASRQQPKQIVVSSPDTPTSESSPDDVVHKTPPPAAPRTNGKATFNKPPPPAAPRANGKVTFNKTTPQTVFGHAQTSYTSAQGQGQGNFGGSNLGFGVSNQNQGGSGQNQASFGGSGQNFVESSESQGKFGALATSPSSATFLPSQNAASGLFGPTVGFLPSRDGSDTGDDPMLQTPTSSTTTEDSRKEATGREGDIEASDDELNGDDKAF